MRVAAMNSIERTQGAKPTIFKSPRALWTAIARASGATLPLSSQQVTSHQVKIGQRGGHEQAMRVLGQATVTHFGKAEDALDDADGVLDLGSEDRKSTRLNSSHPSISYAVFCLKKKKIYYTMYTNYRF